MAEKIRNLRVADNSSFSASPLPSVEYSRMLAPSRVLTTFNGGCLVPIKTLELPPHESIHSMRCNFTIRQSSALSHPVFGELTADIYAFFVPNRVVNESWVNVMGENSAGAGVAPDVSLAPLYVTPSVGPQVSKIQIPVGSVADYYGFPTQAPIPVSELEECNDLEFRGYVSIWNEYFRDQNYTPPIPMSKLNVYEGFLLQKGQYTSFSGYAYGSNQGGSGTQYFSSSDSSGSFWQGAITKALSGEGSKFDGGSAPSVTVAGHIVGMSALGDPLPVSKFHDVFTSALPYPQKGAALSFLFPANTVVLGVTAGGSLTNLGNPLKFGLNTSVSSTGNYALFASVQSAGSGVGSVDPASGVFSPADSPSTVSGSLSKSINSTNLQLSIPQGALGQFDISQMRTAIATQQVYEILARAGSRYRSFVASFFGVEDPDPFRDIPQCIGHIRRNLQNYQVAQTSASQEGATSQGNLTAFSYTQGSDELIKDFTALEHGFIHIFAVVRQKNVYSTYLAPSKKRRSFLDFYLPQLANISEQPIYSDTLNPFQEGNNAKVFGYQEAWWDYRFEPDTTAGLFRSSVDGSLVGWSYVDDYNSSLTMVTSEWPSSFDTV